MKKKKTIIIIALIVFTIAMFVGYNIYNVNQNIKDIERISKETEEEAEEKTGMSSSKHDAIEKKLNEINNTL